jgi:nucleoside-diphosphate-sugar epimerase
MRIALVTGAGGFIGGHLVKRLLSEGYQVRAVDIKPSHEWYQWHGPSHPEIVSLPEWDLRKPETCYTACRGVDEVYNLAADMGGMGFIETHKLDCMLSVRINTNMLEAAVGCGVKKYFFSSSACVYPGHLQNDSYQDYWAKKGGYWGLKEEDAYPADPEDGYGWEKLFSERVCRHFMEDRGLDVRIGRYHNVYGPQGTWTGGREKAPAAICRKIAECELGLSKQVEIWGNGEQQRSYMYIDDCIEGTRRLMESSYTEPLNIGSSEMVTVDDLADKVEWLAPHSLWPRVYDLNAPQGVQGRNSDNTLIKQVLGWEPSTPLLNGLLPTYDWIYEQVRATCP